MNGIDEQGRIIVDDYSGEAMNPEYRDLWRDFAGGKAEMLSAVYRAKQIPGIGYWSTAYDAIEYDTGPFILRALTPEEQEWSDSAYAKARKKGLLI